MPERAEWPGTADYPQVYFLGFALAIWIIGRLFAVDTGMLGVLGWLTICAGFALMLWTPLHFRRARTSISPFGQPSTLITDGPFRMSRNPIYLADAIVLTGLCLALDAPQALILIPAFIWLITVRFIRQEETRLVQAFPDSFAAYARRTRRWL